MWIFHFTLCPAVSAPYLSLASPLMQARNKNKAILAKMYEK